MLQQICREEAEKLWAALDARKERDALQLLRKSEHARDLAFRKHPTTGAYAVHVAVECGMDDLSLALADQQRFPGVLQQQDSSGCAAVLKIACLLHRVACGTAQPPTVSHAHDDVSAASSDTCALLDPPVDNERFTCRRTALTIACQKRQVELIVAFMTAGCAADGTMHVSACHRMPSHVIAAPAGLRVVTGCADSASAPQAPWSHVVQNCFSTVWCTCTGCAPRYSRSLSRACRTVSPNLSTHRARDPKNDIDALHQTLITTKDHGRRAVLNRCELTSTFRRKHLTPQHAANTVKAQAAAAEQARELRATGRRAMPTDALASSQAGAQVRTLRLRCFHLRC